MINWEILHNKFGQRKAAEKFEALALEYVSKVYSEYEWMQTKKTRDGNRDFHNLENELLSAWGEAKYKKDSISLSRKDLDPTILSGLIDGKVNLIIFVTNGKIPESLITRMVLGAKMKGIKVSFVMGEQLSDWLLLNPDRYEAYFEEEIISKELCNESLLEFQKISFYEPISLDFSPNSGKTSMNVNDMFVLNCLINCTKEITAKIELEDSAPLSFVEISNYDNPNEVKLKPGLNVISFLVKANFEYNDILNILLINREKVYYCVSERIIIKRNNQLNIVYYEQIDILNKIKHVISGFDATIGGYNFLIYGHSGMGKSYLLNAISMDYSADNDLTLVTFENAANNNNYRMLCRIVVFLQYGNVFWNFSKSSVKKFCMKINSLNNNIEPNLLKDILNGCFDSNIAKTTITLLLERKKSEIPVFVNAKKQKHFRILLLDDLQYLDKSQSEFFKEILKQQLCADNNTIMILAARTNEFVDKDLEKELRENISNYYELDSLKTKDKEGSFLQNFETEEHNIPTMLIKELPSNLLIFNEILSNLKYSLKSSNTFSGVELLNHYIKLYDGGLIFQEKFKKLKKQYYLLDIIYLFKKGINARILDTYPNFDTMTLKQDLEILKFNNCIRIMGKNKVIPFHDYLIENYRNLRKEKIYNKKTGDFLKYLIEKNYKEFDTNYLLALICKCGKHYFNYYNKVIQKLMLQYINQSEYGTAVLFAELFYNNISDKDELTKAERYYLYLYADCLVHCDNKYRAKKLLQEIAEREEFGTFEKYEAQISLLNQRFWSIDLEGLISDSKIYQIDLENIFMENIPTQDLKRFEKAYEACFNRRMVTLLLLDKYVEAQKAYQDGLRAMKNFSVMYHLDYEAEIATIIMDYARGNMAERPALSYALFCNADKIFTANKSEYVRRMLLCKIDLFVSASLLGKKLDYKVFNDTLKKLDNHNFLTEHLKGLMKFTACRIIDYCKVSRSSDLSVNTVKESLDTIEKVRIEKHMIFRNRELFLYNYLMAYYYILKKDYLLAKKCLESNYSYVMEAGETYKIPIEHNLENLKTIKTIEWFQINKNYDSTVYLLESRFW